MFSAYLGTKDGIFLLKSEYLEDEDVEEVEVRRKYLEGKEIKKVARKPGTGVYFALSYGSGLFRKTEDAEEWKRIESDILPDHLRAISFSPVDPDTIYIGAEPAEVYVSGDSGGTWESMFIGEVDGSEDWSIPYSPRSGAARAISVHPKRPGLIYVGVEVGGLLKSEDGGGRWKLVKDIHDDIHDISLDPRDPNRLIVATGGGIYRTENGGSGWQLVVEDYTRAVEYVSFGADVVFCGPAERIGSDGRILKSEDFAASWALASQGITVPMDDMVDSFLQFEGISRDLFAVTSGGRILRTSPEKIDWREVLEIGEWAIDMEVIGGE